MKKLLIITAVLAFSLNSHAVGYNVNLSSDEVTLANWLMLRIQTGATTNLADLLVGYKAQIAATLKAAGAQGPLSVTGGTASGGGTPLNQANYYNLNVVQCMNPAPGAPCDAIGTLTLSVVSSADPSSPSSTVTIGFKKAN